MCDASGDGNACRLDGYAAGGTGGSNQRCCKHPIPAMWGRRLCRSALEAGHAIPGRDGAGRVYPCRASTPWRGRASGRTRAWGTHTAAGAPWCASSWAQRQWPSGCRPHGQFWLAPAGVRTGYIEPGKPGQTGTEERLTGTVRDACLNRWCWAQLLRRVCAWRAFDRSTIPNAP